MRLSSLPFFALAAGFTLFGGLAPASAAAVAARDSKPSGSLTLLEKEKLLTFRYSTKSQDDRNWIGIYWSFYGGPDNEKYVDDSLAWAYAPGESGEVRVDVSGFQPGNYKAYLLGQDGYKWLAKPIDVLLPGSGPVEFIAPSITTHNARQGDRFTAQLGGLIANPRDNETKFYRTEGDDDWVSVAQDGEISGKPGKKATDTKLVVQAVASDGTKAYMTVTIPVRAAKSPLVEELRVMSYNMWYGGSKVDGYHNKQVRFLVESNVDIVGTQESWNGQTIRLAKALGWYYWQSHENGILSRYPIKETFPEQQAGGSVRIALDGDKTQLIMWNVHLGYNPYGPYDFCFDKMPLEQVLDREVESGRTPQIVEVVKAMRGKLREADKVPVLLTGDFNAPSHLDWTEDNGADHCNAGYVPWPSSVYPINAGLIDSYRQRHPDPKRDPGTTWSPIYLDNDGRPEPMDRIDFVYHKGSRLQVLDSEAVMMGEPKPEPNHAQNEWTSDHKAVLTLYKVLPASNKRWDL